MITPADKYWQRQDPLQPLFPDIEWSKPEQRTHAGRLAIIGGNKLGFSAIVAAYDEARKAGIGEARAVLPDALKKSIPATITDIVFAPTNLSGGFSKDAEEQLRATMQWSTMTLLIGDAGRNSETAILYEELAKQYTGPLTITRDAVDLLKNTTHTLVERPDTLLVVSFVQLQKIFQAVYYPKVLTFTMSLLALVEALHKFTTTYPVILAVLHNEQLIVSHAGRVVTTPWQQPMAIWRGSVATRMATYWSWHSNRPLEAISSSIVGI
ncbi:MAG TPA: hypothetical protein VFZ48_00290 [Candidatus Saccharimonadales bacterium]